MLGRRTPRPLSDRIVAWLWPKRGLSRAARYFLRRITRLKGSPHAIAAGVASGAAVSFLPLPGLHFILGGILAFALRGSLIASAVGTIVGNPWTFPFIWIAGFRIGWWLGVGDGVAIAEGSIGARLGAAVGALWNGRFGEAFLDSWPVLGPTLVGGALMGVVVWALFYCLVRHAIAAYQTRRQAKLAAGRQRWGRASVGSAPVGGTEEGKA